MPIRSSAVGTIRNSRTSDIDKRMQSLFARIDRPAGIYSSDLLRTGQTAEPIAKLFASDIEFSQDLREASCGVAEGKPQSWLQQRLVPPPRAGNRLDHRICEGAESRRETGAHIFRFVDALL
jgi:probable phosphoglycerate mutase